MEQVKKWVCINIFRLFSLIIAAYFFYVFHTLAGFPPKENLSATSTTYLLLSIFFLLLPSAKKLKLGKLFEYEAKVEELKNDVKEFKEETRQILSMQNTLINTVSNTINQNINISLPGQREIKEANEELNSAIKEPTPENQLETEIDDFLASEGPDINIALVKLRIGIEKELRRILIRRVKTDDPTQMKGQYKSIRSLFRELTKIYPEYQAMYSSFNYILKICNAAVHGQTISQDYSNEALQMGFKILDELKKVN